VLFRPIPLVATTLFVTTIACMVALRTTAFSGASRPSYVKAAVQPESERKVAPDFALKDVTGKTVKLSDYRGKVVLLNFWATWCEPCQVEIPWFIEFQKSYKDRDFVVLGASLDDDGWDSVKPYIEKRKINYRMVIANEDLSGKYGGIENLPTSFVIDRQGRIAAAHVGLVSKSRYENDILNLLDENRPASTGGTKSVFDRGLGGHRRSPVLVPAAFFRAD
jgi:cytochrome c biogenesis protein CcmG/thiol:disulfide interchange protein DsbE